MSSVMAGARLPRLSRDDRWRARCRGTGTAGSGRGPLEKDPPGHLASGPPVPCRLKARRRRPHRCPPSPSSPPAARPPQGRSLRSTSSASFRAPRDELPRWIREIRLADHRGRVVRIRVLQGTRRPAGHRRRRLPMWIEKGSTAGVAPQRVAPRRLARIRPGRSTSCSDRDASSPVRCSRNPRRCASPGKQLIETRRVVLQRTCSRRTDRTNHQRSTHSTGHQPVQRPRAKEGYEDGNR